MSRADKPALAKGADAIRKAESQDKLDGTLGAVVKEIAKLHGEILIAARMSLSKAIRIGQLLNRVRASRKGNWLKWIADNAPFSDKTARNYISVYQRRAELKLENVSNLSEAYALLSAPTKGAGSTKRVRASNEALSPGEPVLASNGAPSQNNEPVEKPRPQRRHRSRDGIMDAISPENLERELKQSQIEIDKLFADTLAQISRQPSVAWPEFPARLITHGKALIEQGERLKGKRITR